MDRRTFLKGAAAATGAVAVLAVGGGVWRSYDQGVFSAGGGPAYEPWETWTTDPTEGPLALVRAGILAANPHNTQPWLFRVTDTRIELYADVGRNLGAFDPYLREMHLGLGCALENMALAAAANGHEAAVVLLEGTLGPIPDVPQPTPVAYLDLLPGAPAFTPLYEVIASRHTNRGPYHRDRPLLPEDVSAIQQMVKDDPEVEVRLYTAEADLTRFGDAVVQATEAIIADAEMVHDSEVWFRHSWSDIQEFRDGPTLDAAGLPPIRTALAKMLPRPSAEANHQYWLDGTRDVHVATAPAFGLIAVRDLYDLPQTLRAGRLWQRMHLWAAAQGIAMQPLNQPVELVDRQRQLGEEPQAALVLEKLTGDPQWKPTFAFRAGYPQRDATASPRRPVEQVVL